MKKLLILGAGPGGYECAVRAARRGLEVHIVDKTEHLGGTCLSEGCIPTKCLCHTAEILRSAREAETYGLQISGTFSLSAAMQRKNEVIARLQEGIAGLLSSPGIHFHEGLARFVPGDAHCVEVGGERLSADYIIIATGSVSKFLPIPGAHIPGVLTSTEMLQLQEVPARLCIIGGGVIGLEFASIFKAFGSEVTVIEYAKEILPFFDKDLAKRLRTALKKQGINIITGAPVTAIHADNSTNGELHISYEFRSSVCEVKVDKVLMAVGRGANLQTLNLSEVGIAYTPRGIIVNEHMETNIPGVYAVGDVTGLIQLAHAATAQSFRALAHILGEQDSTNPNLVPAAVFTTPEAAMVGMTEEEAKAKVPGLQCKKSFYRANGRALSMEADGSGMVKLLVSPDGEIVGAHILGAHAAELIHEIAVVMQSAAGSELLSHTIHAHPTLSELLQKAAES